MFYVSIICISQEIHSCKSYFLFLVTEDEIYHGILDTTEPEKHCYWFYRNINDIKDKQVLKDPVAYKFVDTTAEKVLDEEAIVLLNILKAEKIRNVLEKNVSSYYVNWSAGVGISDDAHHVEHAIYLSDLCKDVYTNLTKMIDDGIAERYNVYI